MGKEQEKSDKRERIVRKISEIFGLNCSSKPSWEWVAANYNLPPEEIKEIRYLFERECAETISNPKDRRKKIREIRGEYLEQPSGSRVLLEEKWGVEHFRHEKRHTGGRNHTGRYRAGRMDDWVIGKK